MRQGVLQRDMACRCRPVENKLFWWLLVVLTCLHFTSLPTCSLYFRLASWVAPIFCTRSYESIRGKGSSFLGVPQVPLSVAKRHLRHPDAKSAGVWYLNAL